MATQPATKRRYFADVSPALRNGSAPRRRVVAHAEAPDQQRHAQEGDAAGRREPVGDDGKAEAIGAAEDDDGGEVVDAGQGHHEGEEAPEPWPVDGDRVLAGVVAAVGEGIPDLERLGGPER